MYKKSDPFQRKKTPKKQDLGLSVAMVPAVFGPGSFRPGSFRSILGVGHFGLGRWVVSALSHFRFFWFKVNA